MHINEINMPVQPDTYEASMALSQLLKIGQHSIKLHNLIKNDQEMESWVAKKIDLAGDYVKKVHNYTQSIKAGMYEDKECPPGQYYCKVSGKCKPIQEDAGEGHMSKSTLYHTAKYAIALMQMIKKGDDLEGWVQSKLNKAADYLQGAYNYEEYQKLNPYREDLDGNILDKHSEILKRSIDEILARETKLDDVDTKPGMMRILGKKVNEVEKKMAKEYKDDKEPRQLTDPDKETLVQKDGKVITVSKDKEKQYLDKGWELAEYAGSKTSNDPKNKEDYMSMKKALQDIENSPKLKDPETKMQVAKRKAELNAWAKKNLSQTNEADGFRGNPHPVLGKAEAYLNYGMELAKDIKAGKMQDVEAKADAILNNYPTVITAIKELYNTNEGDGRKKGMHPKGHPMRQKQQAAIYANEAGMPSSVIKSKERYAHMTDQELADRFKDADETTLRQMAWRHGYGNMSSHYLDRVKNVMTSKRTGTTEAELEEGLKDWAKKTAAAGIIVGAVAGMGSINNALNNSVPAIKAMNTALELAQSQGNTDLADMIKKDIGDAKLRLDIGKDLNQVKYLQDKYSKFMPTEGLAYESKLAVLLNQHLK